MCQESIPDQVEQVVESVKVLELSDDALFILKRMQDWCLDSLALWPSGLN